MRKAYPMWMSYQSVYPIVCAENQHLDC